MQPINSEQIELASGRHCTLVQSPAPICQHYFVLFFPESLGSPTVEEADEMALISQRQARRFASKLFGHPECFTIIHNGRQTRRKPDLHYHILVLRNRRERMAAYLRFMIRNALAWLRIAA